MWKELISLWESDNLLQQAWEETFEMLEIDEEMLLEACRSLRESDSGEINKEIRRKDKIVNKYERDVRRKVITHCTVQGPTQLPAGMVLVSIIIDVERIGDYAKNMFDLAGYHPQRLHGGKFEDDLKRVEDAVKSLLPRTRACLESSDEDEAMDLLGEFKWVNEAAENCLAGIVKEEAPSIRSGDAAALALYLRVLKRINSHMRNIITSVVNPFDRIGYKPKKKEQ